MKFIYVLIILIMCINLHAASIEQCKPVRVIDGDTIVCDIQSWPELIGRGISVRLKDCDSPEVRTKDQAEKALGMQAKKELSEKISGAEYLTLQNIEKGKYFRLVADVYLGDEKLICPYSKLAYAEPTYKCGTKTKCSQMSCCEEAYFFLRKCGLSRLDRDKDGIPCESLCK